MAQSRGMTMRSSCTRTAPRIRVRAALATISAGLLGVALAPGQAHAATTHGGRNLNEPITATAQNEAAALARPHISGPSDCNLSVCAHTANVGGIDYEAWAEFRVSVTKGHFHIWGPGLNVTTPDSPWRIGQNSRRYRGHGNGRVCAEGFSYSGGRWHSLGRSCVGAR